MIELRTPRGLPVRVPETDAEDPSPKFAPTDADAIRAYYAENGYAVISGLVEVEKCDHLRDLWAREIKPSRSYIYRQATAKVEKHQFNHLGWVMNPILNLQSLDPVEFSTFRAYATGEILTHAGLRKALHDVLGQDPKIVQSMYFEGNSATWEHQDTYYLDSENVGAMAAAWLALEDISAQAGRFFVCAGSHKIDLGLQSLSNNIADHHDEYIASVVEVIRERNLEIRAPKLDKGDVLIWNARTIHGSLDSQDLTRTRASVTLHAIPAPDRFLQLQNRIVPLQVSVVNGVQVHRPKDQARFTARATMLFEARFPGPFYAAKRLAVRSLIYSKGLMSNRG